MTPQPPATPRNNRRLSLLQYPLLCAAILLAGCVDSADSADTSSSFCTRTEQVVQAILAQIPGVASCEQVTDSHLATITTLDLRGQSITELQAGDFSGLINLSSLDLRDNPAVDSMRFFSIVFEQIAQDLQGSGGEINLKDWELRDNQRRLALAQITQRLQVDINNVYDVGGWSWGRPLT